MKDKKDIKTQFEENRNNFTEVPKDHLWQKLEEKLDNRINVQKLRMYKLTSIAAIFVALIAAVAYLNHYLSDHNPKLFVSNDGFTSLVLEDLDSSDDSFFNTESIVQIREAYAQPVSIDILTNLVGQYNASDDSLEFNVKFVNYSYTLVLSNQEEMPYTIESVGDEQIKFRNIKGQYLTFNIMGDDLILIDSDSFSKNKICKRISAI